MAITTRVHPGQRIAGCQRDSSWRSPRRSPSRRPPHTLHLKAGAVDPARAAVGGNGNEITGLPQISTVDQGVAGGLPPDTGSYRIAAAHDEVPYAADGVTLLGTDPYGIDSESIAVDPRDGSFWLGDEYRPSLVHVAADGTVLNRIIPAGVTVPGADESVVMTNNVLPRAFVFPPARATSTASDAALTVSDPGRPMNGSFALASPLVVEFSKATWTAPVSNDPVTITFKQHIDSTDALRTGAYSETLAFTLSTTNP